MLCHSQLPHSLLKMPIRQDDVLFPPHSATAFKSSARHPFVLCPSAWAICCKLLSPTAATQKTSQQLRCSPLFQKVHLLEQHSEHNWPFPSCCQVPGWGYMNSFLQLHKNHIWKWQAGTWLHGTLVTMCWCENTFQSMHLRQLLFLYCLKTNVLNEWLFFFPSFPLPFDNVTQS